MTDSALTDPFADDEADAFAATFKPKPKTEEAVKTAPAKKSAPLKTADVVKVADKVAAEEGFSSRKPKKKKTFRRSDNFRTGRNEHIGVKVRIEEKNRLAEIAEERDWVYGQVIQYALDALQEKIADPGDKFWESRNFHGVE